MIYYWRVGILYYSDAAHEHLEQRGGRPSSVFIPGKDIGEAWAALKATSLLRDTDIVCEIERWSQAEGGIEDERRLKMEYQVCHAKPVGKGPDSRGVGLEKSEDPWPASRHFLGTVPPPQVGAGYHRTASDFGGTVPLRPLLPTGPIKGMPNPTGSTRQMMGS